MTIIRTFFAKKKKKKKNLAKNNTTQFNKGSCTLTVILLQFTTRSVCSAWQTGTDIQINENFTSLKQLVAVA